MFVDIHAHAYRFPTPFVVRFPNADELLARYDECGIVMGCLLPVVNSEIYLPQANEDILEMAQQHPDRIVPFCNVDPRALSDSSHAPQGLFLPSRRMKRRPTTTGETENGRSRTAMMSRLPGSFRWVTPHARHVPITTLSGTAQSAMSNVSLMAWRVSDERKTVRNVESPSVQACAMTLAKGSTTITSTTMTAKAMRQVFSQGASAVSGENERAFLIGPSSSAAC